MLDNASCWGMVDRNTCPRSACGTALSSCFAHPQLSTHLRHLVIRHRLRATVAWLAVVGPLELARRKQKTAPSQHERPHCMTVAQDFVSQLHCESMAQGHKQLARVSDMPSPWTRLKHNRMWLKLSLETGGIEKFSADRMLLQELRNAVVSSHLPNRVGRRRSKPIGS